VPPKVTDVAVNVAGPTVRVPAPPPVPMVSAPVETLPAWVMVVPPPAQALDGLMQGEAYWLVMIDGDGVDAGVVVRNARSTPALST
jgi:hypothetical protein